MFRDRTRSRSLLVSGLVIPFFLASCSKPSYIELEPSQLELGRRGETRRIAGRAMNHQGRYFAEVMFDWESEDSEIATVDDRGNVTAVSSGTTFIKATARGLEARSRVIVSLIDRLEVPETEVTLSASDRQRYVPNVVALDHRGRELTGRRITVSAKDEDIVAIDSRGGLHAQNPGETEVIAEADGLTAVIEVTVER